MTNQPEPKTKRSYEQPRFRRIQLATEEVLSNGCKLSGETGMENINSPACGIGVPCVANGS